MIMKEMNGLSRILWLYLKLPSGERPEIMEAYQKEIKGITFI